VPGLTHEALIIVATNGTINLNAATSLSKLTITGATTALNFNITNVNLTVTNAGLSEINATVTQSNSTLAVTNGELRVGGTFTMSSGLLTGNVVRVQGTFRSVGGTFTVSSAFINNGTFAAARSSTTASISFQTGAVFSNTATGRIVTEANTLLITNASLVNLGTIDARNAGTFGTGTAGWFTNAAGSTIQNTNAAATLFVRANSGSFANAGAIFASNAIVNLINAGGTGQIVSNAATAAMTLHAGIINTGTLINHGLISGQGTLLIGLGASSGRPFTNASPGIVRANTGVLYITNVTQIGNSGSIEIAAELRIRGATETVLTANNGTLTLNGGMLSYVGSSVSTFSNGVAGTIRGCGTITNAVVVNLGTILSTNCTLTFSEPVANTATGTIRGSGTISSPFISNAGSINADVAGQALVFTGIVTNNALVTANGGTLLFYGTFVNNGSIVTTNGGVRFFGSVVNNGSYSLDATGDADGDGLTNDWEVAHSLDPLDATGNNGPTGDPDGDGLTNLQEFNLGTDPQSADADGDGLPDAWENANGLSPTNATGTNGAAGDPDSDGLTNLQEFNLGTDPQNADTDGNGMSDGFEYTYFGTATGNSPTADPDDDRLTNAQEFVLGTSPINADTDGDGLQDGWEVSFALSALSATGNNGASGDPDTDAFTNMQEFLANTDPLDAASSMRFSNVAVSSAGTVTVTWLSLQADPNITRLYDVYRTDGAFGNASAWTRIVSNLAPADVTTSLSDDASSATQRFYRVTIAGHTNDVATTEIASEELLTLREGRNYISMQALAATNTLFSVLGTNQLPAGATESAATIVDIWDQTSQAFTNTNRYWLDTGTNGWRQSNTAAPSNATNVDPNKGLMITIRAGQGNLPLRLVGFVRTNEQIQVVQGGTGTKYTVAASAYPRPVTPGSSGLVPSGFTGSSSGSPIFSDWLLFFNPASQQFDTKIWYDATGGVWRNVSDTSIATNQLQPGEAILIQRKNRASNFTWTNSVPYAIPLPGP